MAQQVRFQQTMPGVPQDSPVEQARKAGPLGDGNWPGWESVYQKIWEAANKMGMTKYVYLSQEHIDTMADLGSGHEERMKYRLNWLRMYGWL